MGWRVHLVRVLACLFWLASGVAEAETVRLKDIGRFQGWRDNPLVGYGIVTGLSGTGDSPRSEVTKQALRNVLGRFGASLQPEQIQSRNVAAVMVTATLPPAANTGDRIDVTVTSIGDARSLSGGTLLMSSLLGPDQRVYAIAQGQLLVDGYRFDADLNLRQRNHPTVGVLPGGATVEQAISADVTAEVGQLTFLLKEPDFTTAENVAVGINRELGRLVASVGSAQSIRISTTFWTAGMNTLLSRIENVSVVTDHVARVVVNERSGTVVSGGNIQISDVVVAQGDIKVSVSVDNRAGYPVGYYGGYIPDARGVVVTNTRLDVKEDRDAVLRFAGASVADLVQGLSRAKVKTRDMIAILQAMKLAGALHADILVQ